MSMTADRQRISLPILLSFIKRLSKRMLYVLVHSCLPRLIACLDTLQAPAIGTITERNRRKSVT